MYSLADERKKMSKKGKYFCQQFILKFETLDGAGGGSIASPQGANSQSTFFLARCVALLEAVKSCQKVKTFTLKIPFKV